VRGVFFARNCGQTDGDARASRLRARPLIATLDADMQNDPADLPKMIELLGDQHDAVVGYRLKRNDNVRAPRQLARRQRVRNWLSGDSIRDTGCSLKVFRARRSARRRCTSRACTASCRPCCATYGFKVIEHPVSHHPRRAGVSKYGVANRAFRALRDLFAVRWMRSRIRRLPIVVEESDVAGR
jgi:dolichol-phosphate mannosyltransferase